MAVGEQELPAVDPRRCVGGDLLAHAVEVGLGVQKAGMNERRSADATGTVCTTGARAAATDAPPGSCRTCRARAARRGTAGSDCAARPARRPLASLAAIPIRRLTTAGRPIRAPDCKGHA